MAWPLNRLGVSEPKLSMSLSEAEPDAMIFPPFPAKAKAIFWFESTTTFPFLSTSSTRT